MGLHFEQLFGTLQESVTLSLYANTDPCLPTVKESRVNQGTNTDATLADSLKSSAKLDNEKANVIERRDGNKEPVM
jgi:hypothetical protein